MNLNKNLNAFAVFFFILIYLGSFSGCGLICGPIDERTLTLRQGTLDFVPYDGTEQLQFSNDNGAVLNFSGTFHSFMEDVDGCFCGCCSQNFTGESQVFSFVSDSLNYVFSISLTPGELEDDFFFQLINAYNQITNPSGIDCTTRHPKFNCIGSLNVNGVIYENVYQIRLIQLSGPGLPYPTIACYTAAEGLIQFDFSNGESWKLVP